MREWLEHKATMMIEDSGLHAKPSEIAKIVDEKLLSAFPEHPKPEPVPQSTRKQDRESAEKILAEKVKGARTAGSDLPGAGKLVRSEGPKPEPSRSVPSHISERLKTTLKRMHDSERNLGYARNMGGRHEAELHGEIDKRHAADREFVSALREKAKELGSSAEVEKIITESGGVPPLALSPEGRKWRDNAAVAGKGVTETSKASGPDHLSDAVTTYGLGYKEAERVKAHPYAQKAAEHAQAGDHDKAKGMVRAAVKDVLARSPERNMSPSSAERHMKESEARNGDAAKRMAKSLRTFVSLWKGARAA